MTSLVHARAQIPVALGPGGEARARKSADWVFDGPWEKGELTVLAARLGVGLVGLLVCWIGCSGTEKWIPQQGWTAGAIGSVVLALSGVASWIQSGMRNIRDAQSVLLSEVRVRFAPQEAALVPSPAFPAQADFVTSENMSRFHRGDCFLVKGKQVYPITKDEASSAGFLSCGVCRP